MDYIVHGILQARILEWVAFPFSRGSQGLNPGLLHCRWVLYQLSHKGSPRVLEWVVYPFSSRSSWPRNQTGVSCIAGRFFTNWSLREWLTFSQFTNKLQISLDLELRLPCKEALSWWGLVLVEALEGRDTWACPYQVHVYHACPIGQRSSCGQIQRQCGRGLPEDINVVLWGPSKWWQQ